MKKLKKLFAVLAGVMLLPVAFEASPAYAADEFVTIGTGGITGVYYPVGGAICRLVNKNRRDHGVRCTVESTGGSAFNVNTIGTGDLSMGIVQSDVQYYAFNGTNQFTRANKDLRVLFSLHAEAFTLVARNDAKIETFKDLPRKRVNIGDPGSGNRSTMLLLMNEFKWTPRTFSLATDLKPAEMAGALCDNKIDAYVYVVGHPNGSIQEAVTTCNAHIVPVEGPEVDAFVKKHPFYPKTYIPAGIYRGVDKPVNTFGPKATLMTSRNLSEEVAYQTVKAVFENFDEFKSLHPALANLTKEDMLLGNTAPFHPGAIRYYKEAGLMQ